MPLINSISLPKPTYLPIFMPKKQNTNALSYLISRAWANAGGLRPKIITYVIMSAFSILFIMLAPLILARFINSLQQLQGDKLLEQATWLMLAYFSTNFLFWSLHGPSRIIEIKVANKIRIAFQQNILAKALSLPLRWHKQNHSGVTISDLNKAASSLANFVEAGFLIIHISMRLLGSFCVLVCFMPYAGVAVVLAFFIVMLTISLFDKRLVPLFEQRNNLWSKTSATIQDYMTNISTVISLRLAPRVLDKVLERSQGTEEITRKLAPLQELKWFSTSSLVDFSRSMVLLGYVFYLAKNARPIEIGTFFAMSEYLRQIGDSFYELTGRYGEIVQTATQVRAIENIENAYAKHSPESYSASLPRAWSKIEIKQISYLHPDQVDNTSTERRAEGIKNVDLILERGKSYAFVGSSGSGKSTILSLLRNLNQADVGQVFCDGQKLQYGLSHIAQHTTLIPQEPEIFSENLRFNITLGVEASNDVLDQVLKMSRFDTVLDRLPNGLETNIAEKGVNLSGGEKQRLALARGLFFVLDGDSDIILMDESTSSVDTVNETLIYEQIQTRFRKHCVISAVHKFNLLHFFDEILVFSAGQLVEHGTLEQLKNSNGHFSRLWQTYSRAHENKLVAKSA